MKPGRTLKKDALKNKTPDKNFAQELASVFREKIFTKARHERNAVNDTWWADLSADDEFQEWFKVHIHYFGMVIFLCVTYALISLMFILICTEGE